MKANQPFATGIDERRAYAEQLIGRSLAEAERTEVIRALRGTIDEVVLDVATKEPAIFWRAGVDYFIDSVDMGIIADMRSLRYDYDLGLYEDV